MRAFIGLVKKDMLLARLGCILWLIGVVLMLLSGYISAVRTGEPLIVIPFLFATAFAHIIFAPIAMLSLLRIEGKTQLWLYNPQGSMKLLLAKSTTVVIYQIISQVLTTIGAFAIVKWLGENNVRAELIDLFTFKNFFLLNTAFFAVALYLSIWIAFLWVVYHSLSKYPVIRKLRWLVIILIVLTSNVIETLFVRVDALRNNILRWEVKLTSISSIQYDETRGWEAITNPIDIGLPVLPVMMYSVLALILFYTASVLLDKKVEV